VARVHHNSLRRPSLGRFGPVGEHFLTGARIWSAILRIAGLEGY
jgi:hypothetical protein